MTIPDASLTTPVAPAVPASALDASRTRAALDASFVRGLAWTGGMKWATQAITWASTVIVARILTPADYGLVAMGAVFLGLVTMLSEFGFGSAIVKLRELTNHHYAQLNTAAVVFGFTGFLVGCLAAWPLSWFFGEPALVWVMVTMSVGFAMTGFQIVPQALLQRDLHFKSLALIQGAKAIVLAVSMVLFAMAGLRYWTLVLGNLLSLGLQAVAIVALRPQPFRRPRAREIAPALNFSWQILGQRVTWYFYNSADFLIAGRVLGGRALGAYSLAWTLANIPIEKVTSLVGRVTPAFFSAVQDDLPALRRYLLRLTEGLALLTMPATVGLALVAGDFVPLVFGEQWRAVTAPLQVLAMYATLRSLVTLLPQVLNAVGESRYALFNNVIAVIVLPPSFWLASRYGAAGIAAVWATVYPLVVLRLYAKVFRSIEMSATEYLRALWPAVSGCLLMAAAVLALRVALPSNTPVWASVAAEVIAGAMAYAATMLVLHRDRVGAFRSVLRDLRGRPAPAATAALDTSVAAAH